MLLTEDQKNRYKKYGFLCVPGLFSDSEIDIVKDSFISSLATGGDHMVYEKDGRTIRAVHGLHLFDPFFGNLTRDSRLLDTSKQLLSDGLYVHQLKINYKNAFTGDIWPWHQDFIFWKNEDGINEPDLISACVFLDDIDEFNGPLFFIPSSHALGDVSSLNNDNKGDSNASSWINNLTANLKYTTKSEVINKLCSGNEIYSAKGTRGTTVFFHPHLVHSSGSNLSPYDRTMLLVTYNSIENKPKTLGNKRPDFLCGRDYDPITSVSNSYMFKKYDMA